MTELSCFKTYDIRGELDVNIDIGIAYRIGRATSQHFNAKSVVIGYDARETSPNFASAVAKGIQDTGSDVINIGLAGTEEMYWAVTEFSACAGIAVTASHNPINYNGMKIVKSGSQPLDEETDFKVIKRLAETQAWTDVGHSGNIHDFSVRARGKYVDHVLSFVDISKFVPLKIVMNSGNGAAGPTIDAIVDRLKEEGAPIEVVRVHHNPDSTFPNGIPNPMLLENHAATSNVVVRESADLGVAFDGDFDRCFFFDGTGRFVPGEYIVGLLAGIFLDKEPGGKIVHDPRVIWNTQDIVSSKGGLAIQSKTGHAFIKETMRKNSAIYGGEMSAHHYFRDFAYCDSGMIPWLLVTELISKSGCTLENWVKDRVKAFPSSGEKNFRVENLDASVNCILETYRANALFLDKTDGLSITFPDWRLNFRCSNTEPVVRLNVESRGKAEMLGIKVEEISKLLGSTFS